MVSRTKGMAMGVALLIAISKPLTGRADGQKALEQAVVHFGQPLPQTGGAVSNVLFPDEVTIRKNGTVTFVVNGGGHGIAIHAVSKNTTRDDIADLLIPAVNDDVWDRWEADLRQAHRHFIDADAKAKEAIAIAEGWYA